MAISSVLSTGIQGVQAAMNRSDLAAGRIAQFGASQGASDLAGPMVDLKVSEFEVKASAAVIKTGDQMLGTLLDIKA